MHSKLWLADARQLPRHSGTLLPRLSPEGHDDVTVLARDEQPGLSRIKREEARRPAAARLPAEMCWPVDDLAHRWRRCCRAPTRCIHDRPPRETTAVAHERVRKGTQDLDRRQPASLRETAAFIESSFLHRRFLSARWAKAKSGSAKPESMSVRIRKALCSDGSTAAKGNGLG